MAAIMMLRALVVAVPLLAAATAHAQAPGEWTPAPVVVVAKPAVTPLVAPRLSVGMGLAGTTLSASAGGSSTSVSFSGLSFAIRYRPMEHLELEGAFGGGAEDTPDYVSREALAMGFGSLSARYRFNPQDRWNWWLLGGVGMMVVAPRSSSSDRVSEQQRGMVQYGAGVEWRMFTRLSLQMELRGLVLGSTQDEMVSADDVSITGANVSFGGNFYF